MSISLNELYLWSRSNGEIQLVRPYSKNNGGKSYSVAICNRHGTEVPGLVQQASAAQLTKAVRLGELGEREFKALQAARVNVLIFDSVTEGKMICGQLVNASLPWVNVRYKSSVMNRQSHNVYLMPGQTLPIFVIGTDVQAAEAAAVKHYINAMATKPEESTTPELCSVEHAGLKRGFILWNPKSTHAPTVVHPTLKKAQEVQRIMAARHPGEAFHICPIGPGLILETVTHTTEEHV